MERLCNGGNTSIARTKRVLLEIAIRLEIEVERIDMEEELNTKSWNGSKLCIILDSRGTGDAQRQEESEGEWLEFTDLERITMEAASPASKADPYIYIWHFTIRCISHFLTPLRDITKVSDSARTSCTVLTS